MNNVVIQDIMQCNCLNKCSCDNIYTKISHCINTYTAGDLSKSLSVKKPKSNKKHGSTYSGIKSNDHKNLEVIELSILDAIFDDSRLRTLFLNPVHKHLINTPVVKKFVHDYLQRNPSISLTDEIINKVTFNVEKQIQNYYYNKCNELLPLFKLVKDKTDPLLFINKYISYNNAFVKRSIDQSKNYSFVKHPNYSNLQSDVLVPGIDVGNKMNLVNPVLVALFLNPLPILEHLVIYNDSYELIKSLKGVQNNVIDEQAKTFLYNINLLKFRLGDPNFFSDDNLQTSELKRIAMHAILRSAIFELRNRKFNNYSFTLFEDLKNQVRFGYPGYTRSSIGTLDAILKMVSYKPTTIIKNNLFDKNNMIKESVYHYDYSFNNPNGILNFETSRETQSSIILQSLNPLNKIFEDERNKLGCTNLLSNFRNENKTIMDSTGILVINIDRTKLHHIPGNITYQLNGQPINYADSITINNKIFQINSAVLVRQKYGNCVPNIPNSKNIVTYTLVKMHNTNKWFKYDPEVFTDTNDFQKLNDENIVKYMKSYYEFMGSCPSDGTSIDDLTIDSIQQFLRDNKDQMPIIRSKLETKNDFMLDNFYITDDEARSEIITNSTILIYSYGPNINLVKCSDPCDLIP